MPRPRRRCWSCSPATRRRGRSRSRWSAIAFVAHGARHRLARHAARAPGAVGARGDRLPRVDHDRRLSAREHALPADARRRRRDAGRRSSCSCVARLTPAGTTPEDLSALGRVHISLATVGVGVFALASALSAIYLVEERALKKQEVRRRSRSRTAARRSRRSTGCRHRLIWVGFPIFTVALVLGAIWVSRLGESLDRLEYPLAAVTWIAFATLLVARQIYGWRGRRAARLTLAGLRARRSRCSRSTSSGGWSG